LYHKDKHLYLNKQDVVDLFRDYFFVVVPHRTYKDRMKEMPPDIKRNVLLSTILFVTNHHNENIRNSIIEIKRKNMENVVTHVNKPNLNISNIFYF